MSRNRNTNGRTPKTPIGVTGAGSARSGNFTGTSIPGLTRTPSPLDKLNSLDMGVSSNGTRFRDVLNELNSGNADLNQLFASLLGSGDQQFTDERWDMFYQYLLGMMSQANQRDFDIAQRDESRIYNTPTNELARLMGAGISRDAAIQILSGSAGGSGVGSGVIGSGANPFTAAPTGISGTQELQRAQVIIGGISESVSALGILLQSGLSMAQGIEQVKQLRYQNYFSRHQVESFDSVQQLATALQSLQSTGEIESADIEKLSNANDLIKFLRDAAKDNDKIAELIKSPAYARSLGTSYGRDYFNQYWHSLRDSRDAGTLYDEFIRGQQFDNAIKQLQPSLIGAELAKIGQENKESEQRIIESANRVLQGNAQIQVLNAQGRWIDVQIPKSLAETELVQAQTQGQNVQNNLLSLNYEYNSAGFPVMVQNRIDELTTEAMRWNTLLRDPNYSKGAVEQMQKAWLTDVSNAADAAYVMSLYYNAVGDFATEHPGLYQLGTCFKLSGMPQLLKIGATASTLGIKAPFGQ